MTVLVEHCARVIAYLDDEQPTEREGNTRIYGPYADNDGRDLAAGPRRDARGRRERRRSTSAAAGAKGAGRDGAC